MECPIYDPHSIPYTISVYISIISVPPHPTPSKMQTYVPIFVIISMFTHPFLSRFFSRLSSVFCDLTSRPSTTSSCSQPHVPHVLFSFYPRRNRHRKHYHTHHLVINIFVHHNRNHRNSSVAVSHIHTHHIPRSHPFAQTHILDRHKAANHTHTPHTHKTSWTVPERWVDDEAIRAAMPKTRHWIKLRER